MLLRNSRSLLQQGGGVCGGSSRFIVKPPPGNAARIANFKRAVASDKVAESPMEVTCRKFREALERDAKNVSEADTFSRLGMGAFVSPHAPAFHALFRQSWRDFFVTEMPARDHVLSRVPDLTIPPLPGGVVDAAAGGTPTASGAGDGPEAAAAAMREKLFAPPVLRLLGEHDTTSGAAARADADAAAAHAEALSDGAVDAAAYTECYLHKKNVPHTNALAALSQILRISPKQISVAGIKDLIGDTVQRVRVQGVSPHSLRSVNAQARQALRRRDSFMRCSNFSYHREPLVPGDLFGNHFKIILRDVVAPPADIDAAMQSFATRGFPNYYGCQRFSWFGGRRDAAFAVAQGDFVRFAFLFLDYCHENRSLRDLLQRKKKYPLPLQDTYRRQCIKMLQRFGIEPPQLDQYKLFVSCPEEGDLLMRDPTRMQPIPKIVIECLRAAFLNIEGQDRRLKCQVLQSYLWNQALTLRLQHFAADEVLIGDFVLKKDAKAAMIDRDLRERWTTMIDVVTEANRREYTIEDVLHPGFQFEGSPLPKNQMREVYHHLCSRYGLTWSHRHLAEGLRDFTESPRPIIVKPLGLQYEIDATNKRVVVEFALERGSYANVAVTELLKSQRCVGQEAVALLPMPAAAWELGRRDPAYVETFEDVYPGFVDGDGFVYEEAEDVVGNEPSAFEAVAAAEQEGRPLSRADPVHHIRRWSEENLLKEGYRREIDTARSARKLFEAPLAELLTTKEVATYANHTTQLLPNANVRSVHRRLRQRARQSAGTPFFKPRVALRQVPVGSRKAAFRTLTKETWNRRFA